jgi:hypothetical protein
MHILFASFEIGLGVKFNLKASFSLKEFKEAYETITAQI